MDNSIYRHLSVQDRSESRCVSRSGGEAGVVPHAPRRRAEPVQCRRDVQSVMVAPYLAVVGLAIACYSNSLYGEFVHDDVVAVSRNPDVLGSSGLGQLLANDFWGTALSDPRSHKSYRPLTTLSFRSVTYHRPLVILVDRNIPGSRNLWVLIDK
ncbi:protein O-mannosyl-transferase TMTC1-like [Homalodisca vitripennis]|uniref:protein O-mannosyl-transferase TMTC1-like n=1 Tax=Homalodisca vitripennis TaxID=197043 RepID=UPI001EEA9314|nr:protein O-mannosyl-transferase TMTC1-like [Homalodisca vitripennis]